MGDRPSMDNTSLCVRRAGSGDAESTRWAVERFTPILLAYAAQRLGPELRKLSDPEDLVAEVWAGARAISWCRCRQDR